MKNKRKLIFADYTINFIDPHRIRFAEYWKIQEVKKFLDSDFPISERGIKKYLNSIEVGGLHSLNEIKSELSKLLMKSAVDKKEVLKPMKEIADNDVSKFRDYLTSEMDFSQSTVRCYTDTLNQYYRLFPEVNQSNTLAYRGHLLALGLSPKTLNLRLNALQSYARWKGLRLQIKRVKVPRILECNNVPTQKEMTEFLNFCKGYNYYWYLVFRCLATTGLRVHELLKLLYRDLLEGEVVLTGKGRKMRRVFFQANLMQEVRDYMKEKSVNADERFCPKTTRGVAQQMQSYAARIALDKTKFHPHAFRHYFAKQYLKARPSDIVGLQGLLGHSSIETTSIYLRRSKEEQYEDFKNTVTW